MPDSQLPDSLLYPDTKPWWESKTLWINGLTIAAAILGFVIDTQTTMGLPFDVDPRWVAIALGIVNILLRSVTSQPVTRTRE